MPNFYIPTSALDSLDVVVGTAANNIANISTDGFKSRHVVLQSGPFKDEGVRVASTWRDMTPGPAIINHLGENDVREGFELSARGMRVSQENYDTVVNQEVDRLQQANTSDSWRVWDYRDGQSAAAELGGLDRGTRGLVEGSNTDLAREFVNLVSAENAYSAVAVVIRTMDEMVGSVLNVKV
ncbi:flagellar basal body protein [Desulfovibrio sp. OttesenSCG-928-G11]|nr:flagellar basal body protein [Desulfovibrio sp. OttesenSCG-928-G11]